MAIIKCKMCGGDLSFVEGASVAECEYCGSKQTIPNQDNEKKLTLFARADRLRRVCEFDKAAGVYESIVADFPEEAEAYWGLVLCRYGIEYVDDPATGKKVPTCHRSSFDSILEDADFDQACENADPIARRLYRDEAKAIEDIRKGILEVSGKEEPYDIFICYKETDENGSRTIDSVIAQDVYDALTEKGYRTFFSRISLEDKLGTEYEPYIFAALNSAKVMLAFGTDFEYFNAVWVKNEWSRFLALMAAGQKKTLIPCYKNLDAYDMPKEFQRLQAQDMDKVGAVQDLLRGIGKIIPRETAAPAAPATPAPQSALTERGMLFLEDGDWAKANEYFERALDENPKDGGAYLGKVLAAERVINLEELKKKDIDLEQSRDFSRTLQFSAGAQLKELENTVEAIQRRMLGKRLVDQLVGFKMRIVSYELTSKLLEEALTDQNCSFAIERYESLAENFAKLGNYRDSAEKRKVCLRQLQVLRAEERQRLEEEKARRAEQDAEERQRLEEEKARRAEQDARVREIEARQKAVFEAKKEAERQQKLQLLAEKRKKLAPAKGLICVRAGQPWAVQQDGTVVPSSNNTADLKNIVAIALSGGSIGLRADGTLITSKHSVYKPCWPEYNDFVAIAGDEVWLALRSNGTVRASDEKIRGVAQWTEIVDIAVAGKVCLGLRADGTVLMAGGFGNQKNHIENWTDIVSIAAKANCIAGLKADGTVLFDKNGEMIDTSVLADIVSISVSSTHLLGLTLNGTVEAVSVHTGTLGISREDLMCQVGDWNDIVAIGAQYRYSMGVKADGTVVFASEKDRRLKEELEAMKDWKLFDSLDVLVQARETMRDKMLGKRAALNDETQSLQRELANLKGLFSGGKRRQLEVRLAQIEEELKNI